MLTDKNIGDSIIFNLTDLIEFKGFVNEITFNESIIVYSINKKRLIAILGTPFEKLNCRIVLIEKVINCRVVLWEK